MLSYIAESVRELDRSLERGLEGIRQQLGDLPRHYVPRVELDRRFDELCLDLAELKGRQEADAAARAEHERTVARERRATRLTLAGLGIAGASATTGVLALVLSNLPT